MVVLPPTPGRVISGAVAGDSVPSSGVTAGTVTIVVDGSVSRNCGAASTITPEMVATLAAPGRGVMVADLPSGASDPMMAGRPPNRNCTVASKVKPAGAVTVISSRTPGATLEKTTGMLSILGVVTLNGVDRIWGNCGSTLGTTPRSVMTESEFGA